MAFDKWNLEIIEPEEWRQKIFNSGYSTDPRDNVKTKQIIEEMVLKSKQDAVSSILEGNKAGFGMLAGMMAYLQSEESEEIDLDERLALEKVVISKEMQTVLGTDLKTVLSFFEDKATDRLNDCISYVRTESGWELFAEYCEKVKNAFADKADVIKKLLDGAKKIIRKEA